MDKEPNGRQWIEELNLQPHPEGGFFCETYRSNESFRVNRLNNQERSFCTSIYYLLKHPESGRSRFHRIKADEMWYFHSGLPLIIHVLDEETSSHYKMILTNRLKENRTGRPQVFVRHGNWFAAEIMVSQYRGDNEDYSLCGCTCSPGFDFEDFEFGERSYLLEKFPDHVDLITRLTAS